MLRLADYLAGLSGCITDMECEQLAAVYVFAITLASIGLAMIVASEVIRSNSRRH